MKTEMKSLITKQKHLNEIKEWKNIKSNLTLLVEKSTNQKATKAEELARVTKIRSMKIVYL